MIEGHDLHACWWASDWIPVGNRSPSHMNPHRLSQFILIKARDPWCMNAPQNPTAHTTLSLPCPYLPESTCCCLSNHKTPIKEHRTQAANNISLHQCWDGLLLLQELRQAGACKLSYFCAGMLQLQRSTKSFEPLNSKPQHILIYYLLESQYTYLLAPNASSNLKRTP